jgi:pSer/pThr/pTyr-binding forkhead associated (FHA) protein
MADCLEQELQKRLVLYQLFLRLYEHHSSLFHEILQLENFSQPSFLGGRQLYLLGKVEDSVIYIITNLCAGKTQSFTQPQQIWTIGRDRRCSIYISDRYVSRRHAAIQYIDSLPEQGFYLIDFNSTNGTYLNGEPVYKPKRLQDGDRIRLGSITFSFFTNLGPPQVLPPAHLATKKENKQMHDTAQVECRAMQTSLVDILNPLQQMNLRTDKQTVISALELQLSKRLRSEILDDFFRRRQQLQTKLHSNTAD